MNRDLSNYRQEYCNEHLSISSVDKCPMMQFSKWFTQAEQHQKVAEPNVMNLSTIDRSGFPISRIVLLKGFGTDGFIFYTNYHSTKGKNIAQNHKVALNFLWLPMERQVCIKGIASKVSAKTSDEYFLSRPIDSQIGAWISPQSKKIENRKVIEKRQQIFKQKFATQPMYRPEHWGGYIVKPLKIEFWQGRKSRLHDRIVYEKSNENWKIYRVAP